MLRKTLSYGRKTPSFPSFSSCLYHVRVLCKILDLQVMFEWFFNKCVGYPSAIENSSLYEAWPELRYFGSCKPITCLDGAALTMAMLLH